MGLDNVAVQWPRTGQFYEPVDAQEFADFAKFAEAAPPQAGPAAALASHIARSATVRASAYTDLIDLLLGLEGVLYATDAAAEDEDPVIDPDGCAWIAGGLERFVAGHACVRRHASRSTRSRKSCVRRSPRPVLPARNFGGWKPGSTPCATSTATRRSGTSRCSNSTCWPTSTAAAPIAAYAVYADF